jgi:hypothetical protein
MPEEKTIIIELFGGAVIDVYGLPEEYTYTICDHDEGDVLEEMMDEIMSEGETFDFENETDIPDRLDY